ncbi:hypothetical protein ACQZV8_16605 [Magnetococcales bacterium HHB-1]
MNDKLCGLNDDELFSGQKALEGLIKHQRLSGNWKSGENDILFNNDEDDIIDIIAIVLGERFPVQIQLEDKIFNYFSHFRQRKEDRGSATNNNLFSLYLHIEALDPSVGNIRIRSVNYITLRFFSKTFLFEMNVSFVDIINRRYIQLTFPEELRLCKEKRATIRAPVDPAYGISAEVERPARIPPFPVDLIDISCGGFACRTPREGIPMIMPEAEITINFTLNKYGHAKDGESVKAKALFIEHFDADDNTPAFRAKFLFEGYDDSRGVDELVAFVQREYIIKRSKLYEQFF